jgi:uncharacterized protein YyaL (SSP411 family)
VLWPSEADLFLQVYQLTPVAYSGTNDSLEASVAGVLSMAGTPEEIAARRKISVENIRSSIDRSKIALYGTRELRIHPITDDKILADWNGLMIAALSKASSALSEPRYLDAAKRATDFVISKMWSRERGLLHRARQGRAGIPAPADDYASMIWGLTEIYSAFFETEYLTIAIEMAAYLHEHFWDRLSGGYFTVPAGADDIIVSQKEAYDGALPSPNAIMMLNCEKLALITGDQEYERTVSGIAKQFSREITGCPQAFSFFLIALDLALGPSTRVVICGKRGSPDTQVMMNIIRSAFLPSVVTLFRPGNEEEPDTLKIAPDTRSLRMIDGKSTAYVCSGRTCGAPVIDAEELREKLGARKYRDEVEPSS